MITPELQTILESMKAINGGVSRNSDESGKKDYLDLLRPLSLAVFPDDMLVRSIALSGNDEARLLHEHINIMGIRDKASHAAVTKVLSTVSRVDKFDGSDYSTLLGDLRGLTIEELGMIPFALLSNKLADRSAKIVKRLFP
jgi:hypothetical protein